MSEEQPKPGFSLILSVAGMEERRARMEESGDGGERQEDAASAIPPCNPPDPPPVLELFLVFPSLYSLNTRHGYR